MINHHRNFEKYFNTLKLPYSLQLSCVPVYLPFLNILAPNMVSSGTSELIKSYNTSKFKFEFNTYKISSVKLIENKKIKQINFDLRRY